MKRVRQSRLSVSTSEEVDFDSENHLWCGIVHGASRLPKGHGDRRCAMCKSCTRRHDCKSTNMQTKEENAKEEVLQMPVMHKRQKPLQGLSAVRPRSLLNDTSTMLGGKFDTLLERRDEKSFLCCICFTRLCCWYLHRLGVCSHIYHCWPQ